MIAQFEKAFETVRQMNRLTCFGLIAVSLMLLFYTLENRANVFVLAFAVACAMGSVYGFLVRDAWPFGLVEGIWSLVALRRWWTACRSARSLQHGTRPLSAQEIV